MTGAPALELTGIAKGFDGRPALRDASFAVAWGEIHALLGENGAGKSTLMNVACGLYAPEAGTIRVDGRPAAIASPADAARHGIGMVHQHYRLVRRLSVAENVLLGCAAGGRLGSAAAAARAAAAKAAELGFALDPAARVDRLSVAEQQRVEIVKVLLQGTRILLLDEPTAVLADQEAEALLGTLRGLAAGGTAIVLISHKLREVVGTAARVTVLRGGRTVAAGLDAGRTDGAALARAMVGEVPVARQRGAPPLGPVRLEVEALTAAPRRGGVAPADIGFSVRAGEILGVAGVGGNGQTALVETLLGLAEPAGGRIAIDGRAVQGAGVAARRRRGLRVVADDRYRSGLLADLRAYENFALTAVPRGAFGPWLRLARRRMRDDTAAAFARYNILGGRAETVTRLLSGGNAQKLLLARELGEGLAVLVAHSPTRGLDVHAAASVHAAIAGAADGGAACLLISEDLEEVLSLATTVAVMSRGRIVGTLPVAEADRQRIGALMIGHA